MVEKKFKSWHMCSKCGDKYFPYQVKDRLTGITVCMGDCPECGQKAVTLIPISDFMYATTGDPKYWD